MAEHVQVKEQTDTISGHHKFVRADMTSGHGLSAAVREQSRNRMSKTCRMTYLYKGQLGAATDCREKAVIGLERNAVSGYHNTIDHHKKTFAPRTCIRMNMHALSMILIIACSINKPPSQVSYHGQRATYIWCLVLPAWSDVARGERLTAVPNFVADTILLLIASHRYPVTDTKPGTVASY